MLLPVEAVLGQLIVVQAVTVGGVMRVGGAMYMGLTVGGVMCAVVLVVGGVMLGVGGGLLAVGGVVVVLGGVMGVRGVVACV